VPANPEARINIDPDRQPLTAFQADRLAKLTGLNAKELVRKPIAELAEKFRWRIDPQLFLFRRICGRVIKRDPITGAEYPVPFATVHVEDTDCGLLGYFPIGFRWGWFYPLFCRREEIATVTTDACGRFCVYIPFFDIDWILRWRFERICFPDIFLRPSIREILEELIEPPIFRPPRPLPDPPPILVDGGLSIRRAEEVLPRHVVGRLIAHEAGAVLGASSVERENLLNSPAFKTAFPPPVPAEFRQARKGEPKPEAEMEAVRDTLSARLKLSREVLAKLDLNRFIGPFRRCINIIVPEWVPLLDVPDITFRVTQDVNGDGTEEVIYSEGFFDVRWNSGPIPDVTLEASPIAIAGQVCDAPEIPCANQAAILFAGLHPLKHRDPVANPYFDANTGYAIRVNRPHPSGALVDPLPNPEATAPMARTLHIYGCHRIQGAVHYRVRYSYNGGASVPFTGLTWPLYRVFGGNLQTLWPAADVNGWYPILPAADGWFPDLLLVAWPTAGYADGLYTLVLDIGDGAKNVLGSSPAVSIRVDNSAPVAQFTSLRWKRDTDAVWTPLPLVCPVIPRGVVPANIQIEVGYTVTASHLRSVVLSAGGCGGGNPVLSSALATAQHWHEDANDNTFTSTAVFDVASVNPAGAYGFTIHAASRAFNPSGGDNGHISDWNYDPVYIDVWPHLPVAIVNANP